jgi:glycosyltransferase involved in cell wall biosynthesis
LKKRIVIDATPLLYTPTGIGRTTRMLIAALLEIGCDYELVLFGRRLQGKRLSDVCFGLKTTHLRLPRASEWIIQKARLIELLCKGDLYHATDFYMPLERADRAVATIHDLIFLIEPEKMVDHARLSRWVPDFARRCRGIITCSEFSKADIVNQLGINPNKVHVIYWGVDRKTFNTAKAERLVKRKLNTMLGFDRPYFLAVSCSTGRKNTPLLLSSYAQLLKNSPANDLVLAWDAPEEICRQYNSGEFAERIHFIGRRGDGDLSDLYRGATALVFPSLYEGFGLPVLEAMSCGAPVIVSNSTSLPEVGGSAAVYIDPCSKESLVSKLEAFENNDATIQGLREKVINQASQFSWKKCAHETLEVYAECLKEG